MKRTDDDLLHKLARLHNVQTAYWDAFGRLIKPPAEALLAVLKMLGAPVERMEDLPGALRHSQQLFWQRGIAPVVVAWDGGLVSLKIRLPKQLAGTAPNFRIALESGESREGKCHHDAAAKVIERDIEGVRYVARRLTLPEKLPLGYHRLKLKIASLELDSHLISAPLQAWLPAGPKARRWGVFCPLYALTSGKNCGAGEISDLEHLIDWVNQLGGDVVGTLPLLASFLDEPFDPSPYAPVSRLFWNEFYLDVTRIPELQRCPIARAIVDSSGFKTDLDSLRAAPWVEYRRLMALKRKVLEALLRCLLNQSSDRRASFERFIATHPIAQDYAAFRAVVDRERKAWEHWPKTLRDGTLRSGDYDEDFKQFHLYAQWQAHEQMRALANKTKARGPALYLDFPLGVNRDGYDVWRERSVFAIAASGGAPPDPFFTKGQNWGFPPLHPEGLREQGYRYYVHCLRHHLQFAGMLRIDHVMGLHRSFWIPQGFAPTEGVYVRYPAEEFYAILNLESQRHQAEIVGENLGTVPPYINAAMAKHKIYGMVVGQFVINPDPAIALEEVPHGTVASLNTHDTPTFAGFWSAADIRDRRELGLLPEANVDAELCHRALQREALIAFLKARGWLAEEAPEPAAVLRAWLFHLASSNAHLLLINLEDLWLEPLPQNVPGTWEERPNWKRKTRISLEEMRRMRSVTETLKMIDDIRKHGR